MKRLPPAIVLTMMFVAPALPQADTSPLTVEMGLPVPLAGAAVAEAALAGDSYLLSFSVRNRLAEPLRLRRIAFQLPDGIELVAPDVDGIDNDRDGAVDEGDEGFDRVDETTSAWRIEEATLPVSPGASLERAVVVRLVETVEAGSALGVTMIAAGSVAEATVRAERAVPFSLAPPTLDVTLDRTTTPRRYLRSDTPMVRAVATIPSGQVTDLGLSVKGSPAVDGYDAVRAVIGKGVTCDADKEPTADARKLSADFGTCQVIAGSPAHERFVAIEAETRLRDADPFADPDVIKAHRTVRLAGVITRAEEIISDPGTVAGSLTGPLIGARLLSTSEAAVDAGDAFSATYRLVNRGDNDALGLRLFAGDDGLFDCKSLTLNEGKDEGDACLSGISLGTVAAGTQRDLKFLGRLRDDAMITEDAALRLSLKAAGQSATSFPPAVLVRRMPSPPVVSVAETGDWSTKNDVMMARIGDAGTISISGRLPEGRFPGSVRILSRVVDAQTGDPIAPAPLDIERFDASATGGAKFEKGDVDLESRTVDGWTVVSLPLGIVVVPVADKAAAPGYTASAKLSLRDLPEIEAGRLIEIAAELNLYGDSDTRTEEWLEVLIAEPALDLTVRSPDEDRTVDLHDVAPVAVLSCNRGNSGAEAIILSARLPDGLLIDPSVQPQVRTIQAERADDSSALFARDARAAGTTYFDTAELLLRGALADDRVLEPDICLALVFQVRRSDAFLPNRPTGKITAAIEPYTGRGGSRGRVYPSVRSGSIRFALPPILFGPVSERELSTRSKVVHEVSLEIPVVAETHRVDLAVKSSTGLEWTILRLDDAGVATPWRDGMVLPAGDIVTFRFEAQTPTVQPLGWIDTTQVQALAFSESGLPVSASTRLITRRAEAPGGRVTATKTMALDRDCDGNLDDERIQDALFEPVKDASAGDCVNFRISFKHTGDKSMERIVVRDRVPLGTVLRADAVDILREPDDLHDSNFVALDEGSQEVVWTFEGLFEPGAEGEVSYAVKLQQQP